MHIPRKISTLDFDNWPAKYLLTEKVTKVLGKAESLLVVKLLMQSLLTSATNRIA
jgi:hypothetical protein